VSIAGLCCEALRIERGSEMTITVEEKGLRIKEAAEFLGVKSGTVFKWLKMEPSFPKGVKIGRIRILLKSDLVAFLAKKSATGRKGR